MRLYDPDERLRLTTGDRAVVAPGRVHSVANIGTIPCRLLLVQGPGRYDFQPASCGCDHFSPESHDIFPRKG